MYFENLNIHIIRFSSKMNPHIPLTQNPTYQYSDTLALIISFWIIFVFSELF